MLSQGLEPKTSIKTVLKGFSRLAAALSSALTLRRKEHQLYSRLFTYRFSSALRKMVRMQSSYNHSRNSFLCVFTSDNSSVKNDMLICLSMLLLNHIGFVCHDPFCSFCSLCGVALIRVRSASPPKNQAIADNRSIEQRICIKPAKRSRQRDLSLLVRFMQRRATPITQKDVSRR